jgi:hypothetical protein
MTRLSYHILPDDPHHALNILREAAGLSPLPDPDGLNRPSSSDYGTRREVADGDDP